MRVISVYPNFANRGGAQNVALQLAEKLNKEAKPVVLAETRFADIVPNYWNRAKFVPFGWKVVRELANDDTVFLSHHRKSTSLLMLFSLLSGKELHIVHVAHNTFSNLRFFSFFPKTVIAVSNGVKTNLKDYFCVPDSHINVIFNGIKDCCNNWNVKTNKDEIHILLPGRICAVKQQVEIVKKTKGKLAAHIHIFFAGTGEDVELLEKEIEDESQYHYIGFIEMAENLNRYDYVCLFSQNEGLGLSLIEGLMFGKPLITNKLPAVLDVNQAGKTGFVFPDLDSLAQGLNELAMPDSEEYRRLSMNARQRYEAVFTEKRMIEKYKEVIGIEING